MLPIPVSMLYLYLANAAFKVKEPRPKKVYPSGLNGKRAMLRRQKQLENANK